MATSKHPITSGIRIHVGFSDSGNAYDGSQCESGIQDGDILITEDGQAAVMVDLAWPVLLHDGPATEDMESKFHIWEAGQDWSNAVNGKYRIPYEVWSEYMTRIGPPTNLWTWQMRVDLSDQEYAEWRRKEGLRDSQVGDPS